MRRIARGRTMAGTVLVALIATATSRPAHAQVLIGMLFGEKLASDNFNIGFEIGMNFSTVNGLDGASRSNGPLLGLFASWRFSEHFHLYTGFLPLSYKGAREADPVPLNDPQLEPLVAAGRMDRDLGYIDLPVLLQWAQHRDGGIRVGAGPQISFRTSAVDRYSATTTQGTPVVIENDIETEWLDAGLAVDVEYRITGVGLAIGLRYYHGVSDVISGPGPAMHNRVLSGTGRISLGGRKSQKPPDQK
jgi:Outer membrane protein beta-barrel domain